MSYIRIPFLSTVQDAKPLQDCIEVACSKLGMSQYTGANLMSHFLEELAAQVAKGNIVRIPGFGAFGPWEIENTASVARSGKGRSKPVFMPSRGFREEVRYATPSASNKRKLIRHRRNHSLGSGASRSHCRVFSAMQAMRENIAKQLGYVQLSE